jgi:hypothetical protein
MRSCGSSKNPRLILLVSSVDRIEVAADASFEGDHKTLLGQFVF